MNSLRGRRVAGLVDDVLLVLLGRPEKTEERELRRLDREEVVVPAVQHQHRYPHAAHEVDLVGLGQGLLELESARDQDWPP